MNRPIALITGASRGLGLALATGLAREGYSLILTARNATALQAAAATLRTTVARGERSELRDRPDAEARRVSRPGDTTAGTGAGGGSGGLVSTPQKIAGDVTDPAHRAALREAVAAYGGLDLLINNAGTLGAHPLPALADYPIGQLRDAFDVNVLAPLALTQLLLPTLRERGGAVLNITSDAAVEPYSGWGGYGAAKAALEQMSNVLAAEEATVRVWWADPGDLRTDMHQQAFPGEDISDRPLPAVVVPGFIRLITERLPSGRYRVTDLLPLAAS
jgi:NAD(P)-dependent dehydrogenase (short-subunit alcohol dehydrogenase family)